MNLCFKHFIFSERGNWAIIKNNEGYGLLGGSLEFIESVRKLDPELDRQVYDFLQNWRERKESILNSGGTIYIPIESWLPQLLTYIYGEEKATKLYRRRD